MPQYTTGMGLYHIMPSLVRQTILPYALFDPSQEYPYTKKNEMLVAQCWNQ